MAVVITDAVVVVTVDAKGGNSAVIVTGSRFTVPPPSHASSDPPRSLPGLRHGSLVRSELHELLAEVR